MDYQAIEEAGGLAKSHKEPKPKKGLQTKTPLKAKTKLKSHPDPVPLEIRREVIRVKGNLCFMGFCPRCGGQQIVTEYDDPHHKPKRSHGGKHIVAHLFMGKRECHDYLETHPAIEKMMFQEMETAGIPVVWKAPTKGIGNVHSN